MGTFWKNHLGLNLHRYGCKPGNGRREEPRAYEPEPVSPDAIYNDENGNPIPELKLTTNDALARAKAFLEQR